VLTGQTRMSSNSLRMAMLRFLAELTPGTQPAGDGPS
jgi:hypothetical protein